LCRTATYLHTVVQVTSQISLCSVEGRVALQNQTLLPMAAARASGFTHGWLATRLQALLRKRSHAAHCVCTHYPSKPRLRKWKPLRRRVATDSHVCAIGTTTTCICLLLVVYGSRWGWASGVLSLFCTTCRCSRWCRHGIGVTHSNQVASAINFFHHKVGRTDSHTAMHPRRVTRLVCHSHERTVRSGRMRSEEGAATTNTPTNRDLMRPLKHTSSSRLGAVGPPSTALEVLLSLELPMLRRRGPKPVGTYFIMPVMCNAKPSDACCTFVYICV